MTTPLDPKKHELFIRDPDSPKKLGKAFIPNIVSAGLQPGNNVDLNVDEITGRIEIGVSLPDNSASGDEMHISDAVQEALDSKFTRVLIGDDNVGTVTPPRNGGFLFITLAGITSYPQASESALLFYDVGTSAGINLVPTGSTIGADIEVGTGSIGNTSATDGKVMVSAHEGTIRINNRQGGNQWFSLSFL